MDMMPRQLREGLRRHPKGSRPPRPIAEQLPSISVNDLHISSLDTFKNYVMPNVSLRYPYLSGVRLSVHVVEFQHPSLHRGQTGPIQTFRLKHIRTGFGIRHAFICTCQRPVIKLYYLHRRLACRRCHDATYASRTCSKRQRPILQISRIESFLNNKLGLYRRTRERLEKKLGEKVMMAQGSMGTKARSLWK
jgi:hypothetical protein